MNASNPYIEFLLRWYWLIAISSIIAVYATHLALGDQVQLYRSTSTVQVGRALESKNPHQDELAIVERLIPAYAEMASRDPVLLDVIDTLKLPLTPDDIRARLHMAPAGSAGLIDINVVDQNPEVAAAIANEIARQIALQAPTTTLEDSTEAFVQQQLADLQKKITAGQEDIADLEAEIITMTNAAAVFDARQRLEALNAQVDSWQQTYGTLVAQAEPSTANIVKVITQATPANTPIPSSTRLYYGIALVLGAGLGTLLGLGLGLLDRAIRRPDEFKDAAGGVTITTVPKYRLRRDRKPISIAAPNAAATAAYREVRNLMRASGAATNARAIAVTSTRVGEGKTTTIANLGVAFANSGLYVVLVDANLRNPELEELFGIEGSPGFSELLTDEASIYSALRPTNNQNLWIVSAGSIPENYSDILASGHVRTVVERLSKDADIVLFDSPAIGEEQETLLLARHLDGVLLVAESGRIMLSELTQSIEAIRHVDVPLISIVLNKTRHSIFSSVVTRLSKDERIRRAAARRRARRVRINPATAESGPDHAASSAD